MTSLKTSIKTITYLSDIGCLEIQGASLAGYHSGWTATTICTRLKLLGEQERPTKLGLTFAFHHYYRQSVRDALMPKQERAA